MKSKSFWPYGIILAFVVFICGTVGLVVMACSQHEDLVSGNYYEQEIKYQSRIDAAKHAEQLGASVAYDSVANRIMISLPAEHVAKNTTGQIQLYRPSAAGLDQHFKLDLAANGIQTLDASALQKGPWTIRISWSAGGQDYFLDQKIVIDAEAKTAAISLTR